MHNITFNTLQPPQFPDSFRFVLIHPPREIDGKTTGGKNPIALTNHPDSWHHNPQTWDEALEALGKQVTGYCKDGSTYQTKVNAIGCLAGPASGGLLFIDLDGHSAIKKFIEDHGEIPNSWLVSSGRDGRFQIVLMVPKEYWDKIQTTIVPTGVIDSDGKPEQIEYRWTGCQSLVWGNHPLGSKYGWNCEGRELLQCPESVVAEMWVPEQAEAVIAEDSDPHPQKQAVRCDPGSKLISPPFVQWDVVDKARSYLAAIKFEELGWYEWRNVLLACHAAGLSEGEVRAASALCSKHTEKGYNDVWKHIKGGKSREIGIGTLCFWAKKHGWTAPQPGEGPRVELDATLRKANKNVSEGGGSTNTALSRAEKKAKFEAEVESWFTETDITEKLFKLKELNIQGYSQKTLEAYASALFEKKNGEKGLTIHDGKSFLDVDDTEEQFLIPGLIPAYGSAMVSGQPGANKSIFSLQMALAVANGRPFLNFPASNPGIVLVLATDQPARVTRAYMRSMGTPEEWENVKIIAPDPKNKELGWTVANMDKLKAAVEFYKPVLTIVDSIHRTICEPMKLDPKDAPFITYWMSAVQAIANRTGSLLWIHHDGKGKDHQGLEKSLGSVQIPGAVDVVMRLEKAAPADPTNPYRVLSLDKTRGFEGSRVRLEFNTESCQLDFVGDMGMSEELALIDKSDNQKIIDFLERSYAIKDGVPIGFEPIEVEAATGVPNVRQKLAKLYNRGKIGRKATGKKSGAYAYYASKGSSIDHDEHVAPIEPVTEGGEPKTAELFVMTILDPMPHLQPGRKVKYRGTKYPELNSGQVLTLHEKDPGSGYWNVIKPDGSYSTWIPAADFYLAGGTDA